VCCRGEDGPMEILIVVLIIALLIGLPAWLRTRRNPE
jgi:Sec-independent protein translocase protein TatA